jgi:hypothetical protein
VSILDDDAEFGIKVANLKGDKVPENFGSIPIEWTPETISRPICDFPNFRSNLTCFSENSLQKYKFDLDNFGVWIELNGLNYRAFYCMKTICAMDEYNTNNLLDITGFSSFHAPEFTPVLSREIIKMNVDIFRIPQSISKKFVSERFKKKYNDGGFTGLEFISVPLI